MRCYVAMDRAAEGIAAYRRLRQTLSVVLGVQPSESSEQLMQLLGRAGSEQRS
jgi:DNA-binding SARP family transcriptional activator